LREPILESLKRGVDVLIDIDIKGADMIRRDPAVATALADVFIMPPSLEELARRLHRRGTETEAQIEVRLKNAAAEISQWRDYRYTIISGSMEEDIEKFRAVMRAERYLSRRLTIPEA
jgi:guanylate kinase